MASLTESNNSMIQSKYNLNNSEATVASNDAREGAGSFTHPVGSLPIEVIGSGGRVRHAGSFRANNPYAAQIAAATNNKDRDALYERAVEWEADITNTEIQNEYNDPAAVAERQRRAGINPDLAGSAGGAGSAGTSAPIADQSATSKFKNAYDDTQQWLDGVNTAMNVIQTFTGATLAGQQLVESVQTFPARKSMVQSQARISETAADIAQQTEGTTIDALNAANKYNSHLGFMSEVTQAASMFSKDMNREQRKQLLTSAGYSSDDSDRLLDACEVYEQNPSVQSMYDNAALEAREVRSELDTYDSGWMNQINELQKQLQLDSISSQAIHAAMSNSVAKLLNTDENVETIATGETLNNAVNAERNQFVLEEIRSQAKAVYQRIKYKADQINSLKADRADIIEKSWTRKVFGRLTNHQQLQVSAIDARISMLESSANSELSGIYEIAMGAAAQQYVYDYTTIRGEMVKPFNFINPELHFANNMVSSFTSSTPISESNFVDNLVKIFSVFLK